MTTDPVHPFRHHGDTGEVIGLSVANMGWNILTLSFWRFWGRTRVRRMLWSGTTAWDDAVEYTGTGGELFKGFLLAMLVIYLPLAGLYGWAQLLMAKGDPLGGVLVSVLYPLTVFLIAAGSYRARRYQLSRTVWRGIRGGQTGSATGYALRSMAVWLLVPLTLGWIWPWGDMMLARYRMRHTTFGDRAFACDAGIKGLYRRFLLIWICGAVFLALSIFAITSMVIGMAGLPWVTAGGAVSTEAGLYARAMLEVEIVVVGLVVVAIPWARYRAAVYARLATGTSFAGHRFAATVKALPLIRLVLGNLLISFFSFGLLRPWVAMRTFRFACGVITIDGVPDFAAIHQGADHGPRTGEGLISVLDGAGEF